MYDFLTSRARAAEEGFCDVGFVDLAAWRELFY
jgi:hypothetical protein